MKPRRCAGTLARAVGLRAMRDPLFPWTFLRRNLAALARESAWQHLSPRTRRACQRRLCLERGRFFLELRSALERRNLWVAAADLPAQNAPAGPGPQYCNHCGECCEIASGLAEFPREAEIPARWQRLFGQGLGRWHRFCPFLLEIRRTGRSLCAIHPWRPLPCRRFEAEECTFLKSTH